LFVQKIPIHELKRRLSELVAQAEKGAPLLITRHRQIVAQLLPPDAQVHIGSRFGSGALAPLLKARTKGRYLDVVADDRRGGRDDR
jgi:prevent-host-death family protein